MTNGEEIPDKASVEMLSLGQCNLNITNCYSEWGEEDRANQLLKNIINTVTLATKMGLAGCTILRLVIATGDVPGEVAKWAKQLGESWRVSSEGAIGQTLTWGDGVPETTYAIIILSQDIALGLIDEDTELKTFALNTLIHELAHVHDYLLYLLKIGLEPSLIQGNWMSHRLFMARSLWGEYFADSIAYSYVKKHSFIKDYSYRDYITHGITLLKAAKEQINQEIFDYQSHRNIGQVWGVAENQLSGVFNQLGRSLALLISERDDIGNDININRFLEEVKSVSTGWEQVVHDLLDILAASGLRLEQNMLNQIAEQIDNGFRSVGLEPYKRNT
jgi:hypothetical protein